MRIRRGFSLIELLIVLSVGTVMLTVAMSVLYLLKETQINVRQRLTMGRMMTRLSDQFREDVHGASKIERVPDEPPSTDGTVWLLTLDTNTVVRYELRPREVHRAWIRGDRRIHDDYRLPAGLRAEFRQPEPGSEIASLRFEVVAPTAGRTRPMQIEAVLGLANRHGPQVDGTAD